MAYPSLFEISAAYSVAKLDDIEIGIKENE
jgi:hypothetical protein